MSKLETGVYCLTILKSCPSNSNSLLVKRKLRFKVKTTVKKEAARLKQHPISPGAWYEGDEKRALARSKFCLSDVVILAVRHTIRFAVGVPLFSSNSTSEQLPILNYCWRRDILKASCYQRSEFLPNVLRTQYVTAEEWKKSHELLLYREDLPK